MTTTQKEWLIFGSVVLLPLLLVAFLYLRAQSTSAVLPGENAVASFEVSVNNDRAFLTATGNDSSRLEDLIDMSYFEPLNPNMTQEDAVEALGFPDNLNERDDGGKAMEFQRDGYRLDVVLYSGENGDTYWLASYPSGTTVYDVMPSYITEKINSDVARTTTVIKVGSERVSVVAEGSRVDYMTWER